MAKRSNEYGMKIPLGVRIISILYYIAAGFCVLFGIYAIFSAKIIVNSLGEISPELAGTITSGIIVAIGALFIVFSVLAFFVGRGLWKLKQWARIVAIIFAILGLISAIMSMITSFVFTQIISLIVDGFIGGYLVFSKEAKESFR